MRERGEREREGGGKREREGGGKREREHILGSSLKVSLIFSL